MKDKVHVMTYHKGHWTNLPLSELKHYDEVIHGRRVKYGSSAFRVGKY